MIIELFGPPGVGKTTFAAALTDRLRQSGQSVELIGSLRPAEHQVARNVPAKSGAGRQLIDGLRRVGRPAAMTLVTTGRLLRPSDGNEITSALMTLFPPRDLLWSIRLRQYLMRLVAAWSRASRSSHIVLFDQAFIQVVCSFILLSRTTRDALVEQALDLVPKPDLPILLGAPQDILRSRLAERYQHQGRIERFLEFSMDENLRSIEIIDDLAERLRRRAVHFASVNCADRPAACVATRKIANEVAAMAARPGPLEQSTPGPRHGG